MIRRRSRNENIDQLLFRDSPFSLFVLLCVVDSVTSKNIMYPGKGPVPDWSWDRLKYYIYAEQVGFHEKPVHGPGFKDTAGKHLPQGARIPDWKKYNVDDHPELVEVRERLAARGLKNNWLRNEAWRYDRRLWGAPLDRSVGLFFLRYMKYGFAAFVITESIAHLLGWRSGHHDHHHKKDYTMLYEV